MQYNRLEKQFLSIEAPSGITNSNGSLVRSDETLASYKETYFSKATHADMATHVYDNDAVTSHNKNALARTDFKMVNGKYMVRYADGAFDDGLTLWLSMGHEYVHVSQLASGLSPYSAFMEGGAYQWQKNVMSKAGLQNHRIYFHDPRENIRISYNALNLPAQIFGNHGALYYIYDATGQKLATVDSYPFLFANSKK